MSPKLKYYGNHPDHLPSTSASSALLATHVPNALAGLTTAAFNDTGNASGSPFAADVLSVNGNTGLIDASLQSVSAVPEPPSGALLGSVSALAAIKIRPKRA
jgi:hypothetical protein